jgi:hypothetical protein
MQKRASLALARLGPWGLLGQVLFGFTWMVLGLWPIGLLSPTQAAAPLEPDDASMGIAIAETFVMNSSTYRFDGIEGSLRLEAIRRLEACPGCVEYTLYFESRHPGYGDRAGLGIAPVLTPHRARVVLRGQEVVSGVLDQAWDITSQLIIDNE